MQTFPVPDTQYSIKILTAPLHKAFGAIFRRTLGTDVLLFAYPHAARRVFYTHFCPPLRIVALAQDGSVVYDQVSGPGQLVRLPECTAVVETDPDCTLDLAALASILRRLAASVGLGGSFSPEGVNASSGSWSGDANLDSLIYRMLETALIDLREFKGRVAALKTLPPYLRGTLLNAAGLLLDYADLVQLPQAALDLAGEILAAETDCHAELVVASAAGEDWASDVRADCLRCGQAASWRRVFTTPAGMPCESAWRYNRPENRVPLCSRCADKVGWRAEAGVRLYLAGLVWGARFTALERWHQAALANQLPQDWDREAYPLWPAEFGGETWETGSGALQYAVPQPPQRLALTLLEAGPLDLHRSGQPRGRSQAATPWACLAAYASQPGGGSSPSGRPIQAGFAA